jgi:hypothetical protein
MALGVLAAQMAAAGEDCCGGPDQCGRCGCHSHCQKYCKIVPAEKEIKKTVWGVKCEDFCAPLPGLPCGHHCGCGHDGCGGQCQEASCENCDQCGGKGCDLCSKICTVPPKCGCVRNKKTLEKKEVTCKIQCWKCVVVYACPGCGEGCCEAGFAPVKPGDAAPLPSAPKRPVPTPAVR